MTPIIDPQAKTGIIAGMLRRIIHGAIQSSMDELMREPIQGLRTEMERIASDVKDLKEGQKHLETRLDRMDARFDRMDARLGRMDARFDELSTQQGRLIGTVEQLRADVTILRAN